LARLVPCADYRPLAIIALLGFGWLLANLADVKVIQQFALVIMIPPLVWMLLGWRVASEIAFPLMFLLFSVPFGEFLLPKLMNITADFTVGLLRLTGMPVYREGTYFSIPSGDWSVVEACSGLRYLIASITLGCLFAYFNFTSLWRRFFFILLALIVPIISNGFRAYMIVMIAHLSDMTLAMGVDHFIYGWVFFGIVMALLFWFGSHWSEEAPPLPQAESTPQVMSQWREGRMLVAALLALGVSAIWPVRAAHIDKLAAAHAAPVELALPEPVPPWQRAEPTTNWEPHYIGASAQKRAFYTDGSHTVALFVEYYRAQKQGKELVSSQNVLATTEDAKWKMPGESLAPIRLPGQELEVLQGSLKSPGQHFLTWRWNWIAGKHTANDYLAKIYQARNKLVGDLSDGAGIILVTDMGDDKPAARMVLQRFVDAMLPAVEQSLGQAARQGNGQ
jgi:exosortase A